MIVRCISKLPSEEQAQLLGPGKHYFPGQQQFGLVIGREYIVYALSILDGAAWVDILSEFEYLYAVPLLLFDIVDGHVSRYWELRARDQDLAFWPPSFYREYYHDDLIEGVREVVEDFRRLRALIEEEAESHLSISQE